MYHGWHQADHWTVSYQGNWEATAAVSEETATFGDMLVGQTGATAAFTFDGSALELVAVGKGRLRVQIDQAEPVELEVGESTGRSKVATTLPQGPHSVYLEVVEGPVGLDGYVVEDRPSLLLNRAGSIIMVLATVAGVWVIWRYRREN
jgi:hypothetical protein